MRGTKTATAAAPELWRKPLRSTGPLLELVRRVEGEPLHHLARRRFDRDRVHRLAREERPLDIGVRDRAGELAEPALRVELNLVERPHEPFAALLPHAGEPFGPSDVRLGPAFLHLRQRESRHLLGAEDALREGFARE